MSCFGTKTSWIIVVSVECNTRTPTVGHTHTHTYKVYSHLSSYNIRAYKFTSNLPNKCFTYKMLTANFASRCHFPGREFYKMWLKLKIEKQCLQSMWFYVHIMWRARKMIYYDDQISKSLTTTMCWMWKIGCSRGCSMLLVFLALEMHSICTDRYD